MASRSRTTPLKGNSKSFNSSTSTGNNSEYQDLNLNEGHKCSKPTDQLKTYPLRSHGRNTNDFATEKPSKSASKSITSFGNQNTRPFERLNLNDSENEKPKRSNKREISNAKTSSTLSLHIAAYENSVESGASSKASKKKNPVNKTSTVSKSTKSISSPFTFRRQQAKDATLKPAIAPFNAAQKLFNPNTMAQNSKPGLTSTMEDSAVESSDSEYSDSMPPLLVISKNGLNKSPTASESKDDVAAMDTTDDGPPMLTSVVASESKDSATSMDTTDDGPPMLTSVVASESKDTATSMDTTDDGPPMLTEVTDDHDCIICHQSINNIDKKEQFSAGGFKKGDNQQADNWIQCDHCIGWLHIACANVEEFETKLIDKYHCLNCAQVHGPSIMKIVKCPHRNYFWREEERNDPLQIGTQPWIEEFITKEKNFPEFAELKLYKNGSEFMNTFDFDKVWKEPLKILDCEGLNMQLPQDKEKFTLDYIINLVGRDEEVDTIDVYMQQSYRMSMGKFFERWNANPRERLYNMLSFEFSHTELMKIVRAPELMYRLSWVHRFWPPEAEADDYHHVIQEHISLKPDVSMFCLLGMGGSYTDFHIDFGGSSVWYHVYKGQKIFYVIEPTEENLRYFHQWSDASNKTETFLNELIPSKPMKRVVINEGETLMIPSGWIHAVYTPVDSIVFGGNFIHELNIAKQLEVYDIETATGYDDHFLFPNFELVNWYGAYDALDRFETSGSDTLSPEVIESFRTLIQYLKKWVARDKAKDPAYKVPNVFRDTVHNLEKMINEYDKVMDEESYDPEKEKRSCLMLKIKIGRNNGASHRKRDKSFEKAQKLPKKDRKNVHNIFKYGTTLSGRAPKPSQWVQESGAAVGYENSEPGPSSAHNKNFMKSFTSEEQKRIAKVEKADDRYAKANGDTISSGSDESDGGVSPKKRKISKEPKTPKTPKAPPKPVTLQNRILNKFKQLKKK